MNKGKVIDIQEKFVIVMNDQMAYEKIEKKNGLSIGKEVYYFEEDLYKERKQPVKKYFLVAAVIFMMLFIQPLLVAEEAYGYISVDINPSVELQVNKNLEVLSIEAINTDAKEYVKENWIGKPAREVINLIIEETQSKGILNKERNFVLVSYYFNDENTSSEKVFVQSLDELFNEKPHDYSVAVIRSDAETYQEAKEAKESLGKQVLNKKMNTKVDDLLAAKESIEKDEDFKIYKDNDDSDEEEKSTNENALEDNPGQKNEKNPISGDRDDVPGLNKQENESDDDDDDNEVERIREEKRGKAPLNKKAIEALALEIIGGQGEIISFEFDRDDDSVEYEIEVSYKDQMHEMKFNAFTGELIEHEIEAIEDKDNGDDEGKDDETVGDGNENKDKSPFNRKDIEALAFDIVGGEGEIISFEFDRDDEELEYELEILFKGQKHKMKFNGFTGELMEREIEAIDDDDDDDDQEKNDADAVDDRNENRSKSTLNRKAIETLAFEIIGGEGEIISFEFDGDNEEPQYELEILFKGQKHEMEFNGFTGELIKHEIEAIDDDDQEKNDDDVVDDRNENNGKSSLNTKAIEALAFDIIGGEGEIISFEFDEDDEKPEYKLEVSKQGELHKMKFNGFNGDLMEHEIESIDNDDQEDDDNDADDKSENKGKVSMSRESVEAIAFELIGGKGEIVSFDFDDDDAEHEIEILYKGQIYEIKLNGFTGEVIEYDVD